MAIGLGAPPYGTTNAQMQPDGLDVEVAQALARDMGVQLEIVQTTAQNRIPYLQTNRVDLVISSFSIAERASHRVHYPLRRRAAGRRRAARPGARLACRPRGQAHRRGAATPTTRIDPAQPGRRTHLALRRRRAGKLQALLSRQVDVMITSDALGAALAAESASRTREPAGHIDRTFRLRHPPPP